MGGGRGSTVLFMHLAAIQKNREITQILQSLIRRSNSCNQVKSRIVYTKPAFLLPRTGRTLIENPFFSTSLSVRNLIHRTALLDLAVGGLLLPHRLIISLASLNTKPPSLKRERKETGQLMGLFGCLVAAVCFCARGCERGVGSGQSQYSVLTAINLIKGFRRAKAQSGSYFADDGRYLGRLAIFLIQQYRLERLRVLRWVPLVPDIIR